MGYNPWVLHRHFREAGKAELPHNQLQEVEDRSGGVSLSGVINVVCTGVSAHHSDSMKEGWLHGYMLVELFCNNREGKPDICHPLNVAK